MVRSKPSAGADAQAAPRHPHPANITAHVLWKAVEATRSALIITDSKAGNDPIIFANKAFYDLTGYKEHEVIGKNCRFLQGPDTDPKTVDAIRQAIRQQKSLEVVVQNYAKDGRPFWNDLVMSPMFDETGALTHFVGLQLDVSDRINYERQLVRSQQQLLQSNKELEQFTYAASHDLQEPLRMVSSYLQLIKERYGHKLDADADTFIGFATEGAERMQQLVRDLLSLSRVRTTARNRRLESMETILADVEQNIRASILESGATVTYDPLPAMMVDRTQIMQLFQDLISNAIKYRRPGRKPRSISVPTYSRNGACSPLRTTVLVSTNSTINGFLAFSSASTPAPNTLVPA